MKRVNFAKRSYPKQVVMETSKLTYTTQRKTFGNEKVKASKYLTAK